MASTDYLRWDSESIKQLIINRLSENDLFTDQIFEDSNLTVLIDVFSYMYDVLTYQLNHGATEAIFTDAQLYENINRIVKMLGYNPRGFVTSTAECTMGTSNSFDSTGIKVIPKFTTYTTDLTDGNGVPVRYTFVDNYVFNAPTVDTIDEDFTPTLYNGVWKLYPVPYTTLGTPFETITLSEVDLEGDNKVYLSHTHIAVFTKNLSGEYQEWTPTTNLYDSLGTDYDFEIRINENKQYTLKFGDNINGRRLTAEDELIVIYLESNGTEGEIGAGVIKTDTSLSLTIEGLSDAFIKANIIDLPNNPEFITDTELEKVTLLNEDASSSVSDLEGVEDIRENAPVWFRIGGRLITEQDFRQYLLMNYSSEIYDVKVMNNWDYMVDFQQWLSKYDKLNIDLRHYNYKFADSCDFNNVYIWLKSHTLENISSDRKRTIERDVDRLKPVTSEVVPVDPFLVAVSPYMKGTYVFFNWDTDYENKIVITRDRNSLISVERIKQKCVTIIKDFFDISSNNLGQTININSLYNSLLAVDGVKEVRTKYLPNGSPDSTAEYFDGLSFGIWTQHIIKGQDFTTISGSYKLRNFQFPYLFDATNITNRLEVLADNYNISEVEY